VTLPLIYIFLDHKKTALDKTILKEGDMRPIYFVLILLFTFQTVEARKTWEKDPLTWSEKDCLKILKISPWCSEAYKPSSFGSNVHYILKTQCVSPVLLFAEARIAQLKAGESLDFLKKKFESKMAQDAPQEENIILFKVVPLKGDGMRGQNLQPLFQGDPFFERLGENILLIRNNNKNDFLRPKDFKPIGRGVDEGFIVYFENEGFITPQTSRIDLLISNGAGEFKIKFEPIKWIPADFKPQL
jgi:hypothetical protein